MAAILQFRQGSKASFISSGPFISEPFFDTDTNIIHIGVSGSSTITLTKLEDINSGSFSVSGDITGSNLYLSGDITASNVNLSGDITIGGNIILGDEVQDTITISGQFDSNLIPSASEQYDIGSQTRKWNHLYALSASIDSIDLLSNLPSGVISGSSQLPSGIISGSSQLPDGTVSGSSQIIELLPTGTISGSSQLPSGIISGSSQLPDGIVSGSVQVIDSLPSGVVSGSSQVLDGTNIVSSSVQVTEFLPTGTISGSTQILDGSGILSSSNTQFEYFSESIDSSVTDNLNFIQSLNAVSHSHSNKNLLDTINQNLSTTGSVRFYSLQTTTEIEVDGDIEVLGTASFDSDVTIYGDLNVFGTQSIINSTNLAIADNMIYLNSGSTITNPDLGFAGNYNDGTYAHAGLFRDASDGGIWKFYQGYTPEPEGSVDTSHASFELAPIKVESVNAVEVTANDFIGTGSLLKFDGTNIVSSSQQIVDFLPGGTVSGSTQITDGSNLVSSSQQVIDFLPTGTISGSNQVLGGTDIVSSSVQVTEFLPTDTVSGSQQVIDFLPSGTISGSDQVTQSLDTRYLEIDGDNVLSSSNENFTNYSQSVDLRLLNTLTSGSETSQSLHILAGNFPTSGSLGTSAFYNVSSSLADDPDAVPTIKAVFDYINNTIGAADITGVSASLGLSGGGDGGYVSLSLDTGSTHFQEGVELYSTDFVLPSGVVSGSSQITDGSGIVSGSSQVLDGTNVVSSSVQVIEFLPTDTVSGSQQVIDSLPSGVVSGSSQLTSSYDSRYLNSDGDNVFTASQQISELGFLVTSSTLHKDDINFAIGTDSPSNLGATQLTINDYSAANTSGILSFEDSGSTKSFDYVLSNNRYVDTAGGVQIVLKPDADASKSWVIDTDGDLVSNGGSWASGNAYMNNLIASSSVTASAIVTTGDIRIGEYIRKTNDGDYPFIRMMTNEIRFGNVNTENVIFGSQGIRIGASAPSGNPLEVDGVGRFSGTNPGITISSDDTTGTNELQIEWLVYPPSQPDTKMFNDQGGNFIIYHNERPYSTERFKIDSSGAITFNEAYKFPTSDGTTGHALITNGSGVLSFSDVSDNTDHLNSLGVISGSSQVTSSLDSHYVKVDGNQTIGGIKTFDSIVVNGTGSFAYLESVTGSAKIIGDAYIILNNDTPTERYAGIKVYDSGSVGVTSSLEFDGDSNDWFYEYSDDGGATAEHGVVMFGPEYNTKGAPTYNTNNTILKSNGGHHTLDSNITDDGSTITLGSNTTVSGTISGSTIHSTGDITLEGNITAVTNITASGTLTISDVTNGGDGLSFSSDTLTLGNTTNTNSRGQIELKEEDNASTAIIVNGNNNLSIYRTNLGNRLQHDGTNWEILSTTQSTTNTTGALTIAGGVGIAKTLNVGEDVVAYASSDRRLKENIRPIPFAIDKINQIGGYSFDWNTEKQHIYKGKDYGVIAQEIEEVLPELVQNRENGYKAVKYDKLVSLLIEGIKELSQEVKELREKINRE